MKRQGAYALFRKPFLMFSHKAWRPISCKNVVDPKPDPVAFLHRYGKHVRRVPMVTLLLDGHRLRKGCSRMKPAPLGLDGWTSAPSRQAPELAGRPPSGGGASGQAAGAPN